MANAVLRVAGFDLLDDASPVQLAPDWDRDGPKPTVSKIQSDVLDGAAVLGVGSGNRAISLGVLVQAATRLDLTRLVNTLLAEVNREAWELTFAPADGFPVIYDCFRATVTIASSILLEEALLAYSATGAPCGEVAQMLNITCEALPFGRSEKRVVALLTGAPVPLDQFEAGAVPTLTPGYLGSTPFTSAATLSTDRHYSGSKSLKLSPINWIKATATGQPTPYGFTVASFRLARTGLSIPVGPVAINAITLQARIAGGSNFPYWYTAYTILTDVGRFDNEPIGGVTLNGSRWRGFSAPISIPAGATITGWSFVIYAVPTNAAAPKVADLPTALYVDALTLLAGTEQTVSDGQGAQLTIPAVAGTARAPVNLALSRVDGASFTRWLVHTPPADRPDAQVYIPLPTPESGVAAYANTVDPTDYEGTYSVWLMTAAVSSPGEARFVQVSFYQYLTGAVPGTDEPVGVTAGIFRYGVVLNNQGLTYLGDIELPVIATPRETQTFTRIGAGTVPPVSGGVDNITAVLLLDTRGQTIIVDGESGAGHQHAWADEPPVTVGLGGLWSGDSADRSDAVSVASALQVASALRLGPGDSTLVAASPQGALTGSIEYAPRWLQEADQ